MGAKQPTPPPNDGRPRPTPPPPPPPARSDTVRIRGAVVVTSEPGPRPPKPGGSGGYSAASDEAMRLKTERDRLWVACVNAKSSLEKLVGNEMSPYSDGLARDSLSYLTDALAKGETDAE